MTLFVLLTSLYSEIFSVTDYSTPLRLCLTMPVSKEELSFGGVGFSFRKQFKINLFNEDNFIYGVNTTLVYKRIHKTRFHKFASQENIVNGLLVWDQHYETYQTLLKY